MLRRSLLFLSEREDAKDLLFRLPAARRVADRFVAGDDLETALPAIRTLNADGFRVTLDLLGESVDEREAATRAADLYIDSLDAVEASDAQATISLKLTQLGLHIDESFCAENLERVLVRAAALDSFVRIDMEDSDCTEATLRVFRSVIPRHSNVGVVIQSYLHRSERDVGELIALGAPVRLCKGAYNEPASVAFQRKIDIDASFVRLMKMLLDGECPTAIASHDEKMVEATRAYVEERGISRDAFEFQMLYGVRRDYQRRLVAAGYGMRIYVPYGTQWYPYLMRRMAERPANLWFVLRAVAGD